MMATKQVMIKGSNKLALAKTNVEAMRTVLQSRVNIFEHSGISSGVI